jgi:hypothetical protein
MSTLQLFGNNVKHQLTGDSDACNTPLWLASLLPKFDLDPCSNALSNVMSRRRICLPEDGLAADWGSPKSIWCNPPYSNPLPWVTKARNHDCEQLWLVKLDPSTRWWSGLMAAGGHPLLFRRRIQFEMANGSSSSSTNFCSAFVYVSNKGATEKRSEICDLLDQLVADKVLW